MKLLYQVKPKFHPKTKLNAIRFLPDWPPSQPPTFNPTTDTLMGYQGFEPHSNPSCPSIYYDNTLLHPLTPSPVPYSPHPHGLPSTFLRSTIIFLSFYQTIDLNNRINPVSLIHKASKYYIASRNELFYWNQKVHVSKILLYSPAYVHESLRSYKFV